MQPCVQSHLPSIVLASVLLLQGAPAYAVLHVTVNEQQDIVGGSCAPASLTCTLRAAVRAVNASGDVEGAVIHIPSGHYRLTIPGTHEDDAETGDLDITTQYPVDLIGEEASRTIVDGGGIDRVFDVRSYSPAFFRFLTITGGSVPETPGTAAEACGGGIRVGQAGLHLLHSRVVGNHAEVGAGICARETGNVMVEDTLLSENMLVDIGLSIPDGGAVFFTSPWGELIVNRSTVAGNLCPTTQPSCVGGISANVCWMSFVLRNSTISGNDGTGMRVRNCNLQARHATVVGNSSQGVEFVSDDGGDWTLSALGSVFANNTVRDCNLVSGSFDLASGTNLDTDDTCGLSAPPTGFPATNPQLFPLGYYTENPRSLLLGVSNPTPTHHPRPGSPLIDAASILSCASLEEALYSFLPDDQDCYERPDGESTLEQALCDIGSVEVLPCEAASDVILSGLTLMTGTYESCTWMQVLDAPIGTGETVALRARQPIQIGNGFSVGPGAALTIDMARDAGWSP